MADTCYYSAQPGSAHLDAVEEICEGELWECQTCGEQYCQTHWHETELGRNVECVACERARKDAAKQDEAQLVYKQETVPELCGLPLRLSVSPTAIREHFETSLRVLNMSDQKLAEIGAAVLQDDELYEAFNLALREAFEDLAGFDPDEDEEDEEDG